MKCSWTRRVHTERGRAKRQYGPLNTENLIGRCERTEEKERRLYHRRVGARAYSWVRFVVFDIDIIASEPAVSPGYLVLWAFPFTRARRESNRPLSASMSLVDRNSSLEHSLDSFDESKLGATRHFSIPLRTRAEVYASSISISIKGRRRDFRLTSSEDALQHRGE